jgi:osmotically-inducible protein OsmY
MTRQTVRHGEYVTGEPSADDHLIRLARQTIDSSCLRRWSDRLHVDSSGGFVTLSGRLPTYYLKQVLQTIVARVPGVQELENHVVVAPVSSSREEWSPK